MNLKEARVRIAEGMAEMNRLYGRVVFDEWMIVSLGGEAPLLLAYGGERREEVKERFGSEMSYLRSDLEGGSHEAGDFEFAREAPGTHYDVFMVLGNGLFLILNHTERSMWQIRQDPLWKEAQTPLARMGDLFRADPMSYPEGGG